MANGGGLRRIAAARCVSGARRDFCGMRTYSLMAGSGVTFAARSRPVLTDAAGLIRCATLAGYGLRKVERLGRRAIAPSGVCWPPRTLSRDRPGDSKRVGLTTPPRKRLHTETDAHALRRRGGRFKRLRQLA